jgi:hypothetical protein
MARNSGHIIGIAALLIRRQPPESVASLVTPHTWISHPSLSCASEDGTSTTMA